MNLQEQIEKENNQFPAYSAKSGLGIIEIDDGSQDNSKGDVPNDDQMDELIQ